MAMAVARIRGWMTLRMAALSGLILKKRKNSVRKTKGETQALLWIKRAQIEVGTPKASLWRQRKSRLCGSFVPEIAINPPNMVPETTGYDRDGAEELRGPLQFSAANTREECRKP